MLEEGCEMLGNLSLLTALALFARHAADEHRKSEPLVRAVRFKAEDSDRWFAAESDRRDVGDAPSTRSLTVPAPLRVPPSLSVPASEPGP